MTNIARSRSVLVCATLVFSMRSGSLGAESAAAVRVAPDDRMPIPMAIRLPDAPPVYPVLKVATPPRIDGKLDEECWKTARPIGRFYLDSGDGPMRYETIARLVRDDTYLYLGVDCRHPAISDVRVSKGMRDHVSWVGETVELFLDTDRTAADYVQVIFDMSGAFTDTYGGVPSWNGDIVAATDVGGDGWRLEARLKIADLGGGGKVDPHVWGANIARSSGDDSGSWARLLGTYQQPDLFGLLTFCEGDVAVEDIGLGVFGPVTEGSARVPVRLRLGKATGGPFSCLVTCTPVTADGHEDASRTTKARASVPCEIVTAFEPAGVSAVAVTVLADGKDDTPLFKTVIPVRLDKSIPDCLVERGLTLAIRAASPVAIEKEQAAAYLMARSLQSESVQRSGQLTLISLDDGKVVWQTSVELAVSADATAVQRVGLPVERMKDGQYAVEWSLAGEPTPSVVRSELAYSSLGMAGIQRLLSTGRIDEVLDKLKCPLPTDKADRAIVQVWIDRLVEAIERQAADKDLDLSAKILRSYRQLMRIVSVLRGGQGYTAVQRGWFEAAFFSPVDGTAQPFSLFIPYDYDNHPEQRYPLVVWLHGHGGTHNGEAGFALGKDSDIRDRIQLKVLARGRASGYGAITVDEVMREIRQVQARYRVDAEAVHLRGGSMGGFGTFAVATAYPDLFATASPYCGGGEGEPIEQMCNLPTFVHHGLADDSVPVHCSIVSVLRMQESGCPVQLYTYPGVGHDVEPAAGKVVPWEMLKDIRRDLQPRTVVLTGGLPQLKKAYWLSIPRYSDIHKDAYVRATFVGRNLLSLAADNVAWLKVSLPCKWVDARKPLRIVDSTGQRWTEISPGEAKAIYIDLTGKTLQATAQPKVDFEDPTVYTGGGARGMFWLGRPVRIVYGTTGSAEQTESLARMAAELRRGTPFSRLEVGGLPVLKDSQVDEQTLQTCDLILLGTPKDNSLVARMAGQLPVKFADGRVHVEADTAMSWPAGEVTFSLYYRNPLAEQRRIWWFAGLQDSKGLQASCEVSRRNVFGLLCPELIVQARDSMQVIATAEVTPEWRLVRPGPLQPTRTLWASRADFDRQFNEAMQDAFAADISVVVRSFRSEPLGWEHLTGGEAVHTLPTAGELLIVPIPGRDLLRWRQMLPEMAKQVNASSDLPWAGVDPKAIQPDSIYDVLMVDGSFVAWSLGRADVPMLQVRPVPTSQYQAALTRFLREKGFVGGGKAATSRNSQ
jgi:hypothetical protein